MNATQIKTRLLFMSEQMVHEATQWQRGQQRDQLLRVAGEISRRARDGSIPPGNVAGVLEGAAVLISQRAAERIPAVVPWS